MSSVIGLGPKPCLFNVYMRLFTAASPAARFSGRRAFRNHPLHLPTPPVGLSPPALLRHAFVACTIRCREPPALHRPIFATNRAPAIIAPLLSSSTTTAPES